MLHRYTPPKRTLGVEIVLMSAIVVGTVASCGGGGGGTPTAPPTPAPTASATPTPIPSPTPAPAPTVSLGVDRTDLLRGQSATLQWNAPNATAVVESNFGATGVSGSAAVSPAQTTTYSLTVKNNGGQTAVGSVVVRVAEVAVGVAPATGTVDVSRQLPFAAQVSGAVDTGVSWSVDETGGGTITPEGVYSAPSATGVFHVRAVSNADTGKVAVVEVRVRAAGGNVSVN